MHTSLPKDLVRAIMIASALVLAAMLAFPLLGDSLMVDEERRVAAVGLDGGDGPVWIAPEEPVPLGERGLAESALRESALEQSRESKPRTFGALTIRVLARDGHTPIKDAAVWTVPSHSEQLVTGSDGTVSLHAESPEVLVGVESAPGYLLWDPRNDPDGVAGERGSVLEEEIEVAAGTSVEVDLFVRLGGVIRGSIVDANGAPMPERSFGFAAADGQQWAPGHRRRTRADGSFEIVGLAPGWYLVAPDPHVREIFKYERVEVDWGTLHEVALQELPTHTTRIELVPEGIQADEPWPFSISEWVTRDDQMKLANPGRLSEDIYNERRSSSGDDPRGAVVIERDLPEGPYRITLTAWTAPSGAGRWLGAWWKRTYWFDVDAAGDARFRQQGEQPGEVNRITMSGMENVALIDAPIVGPRSTLWLYWRGPQGDWQFYVPHIHGDANGARSLRGAMDLSQMTDHRLLFYEKVVREPQRTMDSIDLVRGRNEFTLQFLGPQEER